MYNVHIPIRGKAEKNRFKCHKMKYSYSKVHGFLQAHRGIEPHAVAGQTCVDAGVACGATGHAP